jgi:integrase
LVAAAARGPRRQGRGVAERGASLLGGQREPQAGGVDLAGLLVRMQPAGRRGSATSYKPFLHHITQNKPERRSAIKLKTSSPRPKVLTVKQVQAILDACDHLRDRLLFALLLDVGMRIGEALGLRHEDMGIAEREVTVKPRDNDNRARAKAGRSRVIPASPELMRLYADYLNREYGALDSDYVFVNLWAEPLGRPWAYPAVYDLVLRLRERTGIDFEPHQYRHTYATWLLRKGAGMESVKELLGHASITTTIDTCGHLTVEDARATLQAAGWFTGREVRL